MMLYEAVVIIMYIKKDPNTISGFSNFLLAQEFQFHVTANFNRTTSYRTGRDKLKGWSSFVERQLFGRNYYKKALPERMAV